MGGKFQLPKQIQLPPELVPTNSSDASQGTSTAPSRMTKKGGNVSGGGSKNVPKNWVISCGTSEIFLGREGGEHVWVLDGPGAWNKLHLRGLELRGFSSGKGFCVACEMSAHGDVSK